jgi:hypothetical protein
MSLSLADLSGLPGLRDRSGRSPLRSVRFGVGAGSASGFP